MNKTALITGAASGIGAAIATALSTAGYSVILNYRTHQDRAVTLAQQLTYAGAKAVAIQADITTEAAVNQMIQTAQNTMGQIDLLVNNAGSPLQKLLTDTTQAEWNTVFSANMTGMFLCTKKILPGMIAQKSGKIINISSMWGVTGASCEVAYSSSKAAVIGFTKSLAKEVAPSGITVNCVAPGVIDTPMIATLSQATRDLLRDEIPLGHIGTPQDVSNAVLFLASTGADFITGEILNVNGGMVI